MTMAGPRIVEIALSLIVRDPGLQPRETLDADTVTQYAEDMVAGIAFPPPVVYHDGDRHWLSQGFHRCEAAEMAGLEAIEVEVREGTRDDAVWDAAGSNREFDVVGRRRSNADKQRAIMMALDVHPDWSDRRLADHVGVNAETVRSWKARCRSSAPDRVIGADGKSYPANGHGRGGSLLINPRLEVVEGREPFRLESPSDIDPPRPTPHPTFNQTNEMVDWAKWTWNPVTGCKHDCIYCYARDIAVRFYPEKFEPTYRPERLSAPRNTVPPPYADKSPDPVERTAWRNVFVCSMADLFGRWVPDEWIDGVFGACRRSPQWNYLFLTKFPNRYVDLEFPPNSWVGTSVDEQKRVANAEKSFASLSAPVKWLSVEPMREPIRFKKLSMFDWVVIGGQSRSSGAPEFFPDFHWVNDLIARAHDSGCKVYCKPNADPARHWAGLCREYPDAFMSTT